MQLMSIAVSSQTKTNPVHLPSSCYAARAVSKRKCAFVMALAGRDIIRTTEILFLIRQLLVRKVKIPKRGKCIDQINNWS